MAPSEWTNHTFTLLVGVRTGRLVVVPTVLVRGNQHTVLEIQEAMDRARERHPAAAIH